VVAIVVMSVFAARVTAVVMSMMVVVVIMAVLMPMVAVIVIATMMVLVPLILYRCPAGRISRPPVDACPIALPCGMPQPESRDHGRFLPKMTQSLDSL
jgi:hypothetical protein